MNKRKRKLWVSLEDYDKNFPKRLKLKVRSILAKHDSPDYMSSSVYECFGYTLSRDLCVAIKGRLL